MSDYPHEVQIVVTRWVCGYIRPTGSQCLHKTQGLAENCIKNRAAREKARDLRIQKKRDYLAMMRENKEIVTALIGGESVRSQAEKYGRTPYFVTTIFHECADDAIRHRIDGIVRGKDYGGGENGLIEVKKLKVMCRQVSLTWARDSRNRPSIETLLAEWWPVVLKGNNTDG